MAASLIAAVSEKPHKTNPRVDSFAVEIPLNTIFIGHLNTDMDSIGSSIGAAYLFGGTACAASALNTETQFALKEWGLEEPVRFEEYKGDKSKVCLMDHNQESQIAATLDLNSICGVIDHHALQSGTVITDRPIYIDIRPWGSACTIVGHTFLRIRKHIPPKIAGVLLSGILSDTLNLRSPTTTDHDRLLVAVLAKISHCDDIDLLADKQFAAKSEALQHLSPYEVACGDQKKFNIKDEHGELLAIGFGVVETTDPGGMINRIDELMIEVASLKAEQSLDFSFLAIVDIVKLTSTLLLIGKSEAELAQQSFSASVKSPNDDGIGTMELKEMVSRKKDFVPMLTKSIGAGFKASEPALEKTQKQKEVVVEEVYGVVQKEWSLEACCNVLVRKMKKGAMKRVSSFASMATPGGGWSNLVIGSSGNTGKGPSLATIAASPPEPQMFAKAKAPSLSSQPRPLKPREPPPKKTAPSNPQNNNSGTSLNVLAMVISAAVGAGLTLLLLKVTNRK
ncbi:hypothetical protein TrLO_g741 [Triparma laevis f. longispina]|uniref:inorganic diphosphatase n=1 Tax=Triparma laevis f. longispina TaxID=1714387 RepID=A0A9W7DT93_9STRA|nr:hypothetical protein TrLO_g741 [Triparma laevis f. longispina]